MRYFVKIFLFFFCCIPIAVDAQMIDYLDIDNGLSNNTVRSIYKDRQGVMWLGTNNGLNRYDGYEFKVFRNKLNDDQSLISNSISALNGDKADNLWIGTRDGLCFYNILKGQFRRIFYNPFQKNDLIPVKAVIKDIAVDINGNIIIASEGLGLLYCPKGKLVARQIPLLFKGKYLTTYGVQSIRRTDDGKIWIFVQNLGLCIFDTELMKLDLVNSAVTLALCLEINHKDIWIGTINGLYKYNTVNSEMRHVLRPSDGKLSSHRILSLAMDRNENLWIGTYDKGVNIYNLKSESITSHAAGDNKPGLGSGAIYTIYIDPESRKWIGTSLGGVGVIDPHKNRFQTITHKPGDKTGLSSNAISGFYEDIDGKLWIGTENAGLNIWNRKNNSFRSYKNVPGDVNSISGNSITSIISDYKKEVWLGTISDGINRYNRQLNNFKRYKCIDPRTGIESIVVYKLYEDRQGNLWAATLRRGSLLGALYVFNRKTDKFDLFDTALSDLFTIQEDSAGNLWGGNLTQLVKIDRVNKKHKFFNIGYLVRSIYEDRERNFWIGTDDGGVMLFDRNKSKIVKKYSSADGLCNNSILSILDDERGNLWLGTFNGLAKFNLTNRTFKNFYQGDGLQSNQFQSGSALKLKSNELVFGGIKGFSLFQPSSIIPIDKPSNLLLTSIKINNKPIEANQKYIKKAVNNRILELEVPYDEAILSFGFTALEYSTPNKISYAYYMEGWDRGWNKAENLRTAAYTHIHEGTYLFNVKCTNTEGIWNKQQLSVKIVVLPPWYRTWWAYLGYLILFCSGLLVYFLYHSRQTKLKYEIKIANLEVQRKKAEYESELTKHEKERVVNEKERELNEKRLSFFTNVSHEFRTPLTLIINPIRDLIEKTKRAQGDEPQELKIVERNARRMLSLVDQLLLFRKTDDGHSRLKLCKLNLYQLSREVYLCFTQQANSKGIDYDIEFDDENIEIYADREKLEIILFNLISNALKYTPPSGKVNIKITESAEHVSILVIDNGYGIPAEAGDQLFDRFYQAERTDNLGKPGFGIGLFLAKQFADAHSGKLSYDSTIGEGTVFTLTLLKGHTHFENFSTDNILNENSDLLSKMSGHDEAEFDEAIEIELNDGLISDKQSILVVDDEQDIRKYIKGVFKTEYIVYEAENGEEGLKLASEKLPDLIITDYKMQGIDGIELCEKIKVDPALFYIPVILLTASSSQEVKLRSLEGGADDFITKPFQKEHLVARVANLLKNRNNLQSYFYNEITLQSNPIIISEEYKRFLEKCISIVEKHISDPDFDIKALADEIGMSHSNLYKKVKFVSGQSIAGFIRFIRLRKAAEIMINTDCKVNEVAFQTGFNDSKYFGKQFQKLFQLNPSDFIKKHRNLFNKRYKIN